MKIRVYSDFHLDHYSKHQDFWYPPSLLDDKETILVLAGDLWIGSKFIEWGETSWIANVAENFKQVLIVLGNHDYWPQGNLSILNGANKLNGMLADRYLNNVSVLDCDCFEVDDFLFVGATLWTDMLEDPLAMFNMERFMSYDGKIAYETGLNGQYHKFTSEKWVLTNKKHRDYLKHIVEQNKNKKVIVITHHSPLEHLINPIYIGDTSNAYYVNNMSDFILDNEHIKMWIFGHVHHQFDIMFGECRIINNAVGYKNEGLFKNVVHKTIEIF